MYRLEELKNKIAVENYLEHYIDVAGFLEYCKQCENYGRIWACPPYDFDPEGIWKKYKYLHLLGTKIVFDQATIDEELEGEALKEYISQIFLKEKSVLFERIRELEKKYPGSIGLSAGSCHICAICSRPSGKACLYPEEMRYSIESIGGDVQKTARELLGIELKWSDGRLPEYFTLVNGLLTNDPDVEI
ncbi:MAG TPA: DUF2284 domain-containing protein [Bacillota bacterium]|nr:DUF2284 domain-containing protein [Bacillota bacterium]